MKNLNFLIFLIFTLNFEGSITFNMKKLTLNKSNLHSITEDVMGEVSDHDRQILASLHEPFFGSNEVYRPVTQQDTKPLVITDFDENIQNQESNF
jgi:hypothetical protein